MIFFLHPIFTIKSLYPLWYIEILCSKKKSVGSRSYSIGNRSVFHRQRRAQKDLTIFHSRDDQHTYVRRARVSNSSSQVIGKSISHQFWSRYSKYEQDNILIDENHDSDVQRTKRKLRIISRYRADSNKSSAIISYVMEGNLSSIFVNYKDSRTNNFLFDVVVKYPRITKLQNWQRTFYERWIFRSFGYFSIHMIITSVVLKS